MEKYIVITTINPLTPSVKAFKELDKGHLLLVGDNKSVDIPNSRNMTFFNIKEQEKSGFKVAEMLPFSHYSRKNLGYLYAMSRGATAIYETDDDNAPLGNWEWRDIYSENELHADSGFINVFRYFSTDHCWPRGFPLGLINEKNTIGEIRSSRGRIGVWQGLVDGAPDVDAVYRLIFSGNPKFKPREPIHVTKGDFAPFNSQNTFWFSETFPLMYLPAFVNFRFTDILRGYITQRIMWEYDLHLGFSCPDVFQERNIHNLMDDFRDEVQVYLEVERLARILLETEVKKPMTEGLFSIYLALNRTGIVVKEELELLSLWCEDVEAISGRKS